MAIALDGNLADWTATDRLELPGSGVAGYALYGRYEAVDFVFALSAPIAIGANTTFWLNADRSLSTGYKVWGFAAGAEYNINFDASGVPHLYTGSDGQTLVSGATVNYAFSADKRSVEFSIAASAIGSTTAIDVYVDVNNATFLPTSYANYVYTVAAPTTAPLPITVGNVVLDGGLTEWSAADRIDASLGVAGYEVYARITVDNYVIALKSPTAIGVNTTVWLNTDRNAASGFQIFGFAGGAEYNVNFDSQRNAVLFTGSAGQMPVAGGDIVERFSADNTIVELAIPKALLGFAGTTPAEAINTLFDINDSVFLPSTYGASQYTIAPPGGTMVGNVTLDGNLGEWTATHRIDSPAPVAGFEVYGRTTAESYVFAIKAPVGVSIGASSTIWLNTDQSSATGFQIFGFAGGAEYNINFDASGIPYLYTGDAGATLVSTEPLAYGRSADGAVIEVAVTKSLIGSPVVVNPLIDVNDLTYLPRAYSGPQYTVTDALSLPARTDFSKKIAIVYSETTAHRYFGPGVVGEPTPAQVNINETAYSQLFMAAQNQAAMAGIQYDLLTESDLTNLGNLVNYDAIVFPSFQFVNLAHVAAIESNLKLLAQNYNTSLIAGGNFMTTDQNGALLAGDPYARMKALFDLQSDGGSYPVDVAITSAGFGFAGVGGYAAGDAIHTYNGSGYLRFADATPGFTNGVVGDTLTTIDNQTVMGVVSAAVVTSSINGDRNVHFSTEALLGDNNQLWQAIQYAVNGSAGPSVGLQMGRQTSIFASHNDMDQSQFSDEVNPNSGQGIYDQLIPILDAWKAAYNFVGPYYINVGDRPAQGEETIWATSLPYYQHMLAAGNEIGSHSLTHLVNLTPTENTNILTAGTGPGTFDYEFRSSRDVIEANIAAAVAGFQLTGAAVPGAPEYLATAEHIIQYYDYISGGYAAVNAGYPGAIGFLTPAYDDVGKVYIAPNMKFDFTLVGFEQKTWQAALAEWQAEFAALTSKAEVPIVVLPWHDYGPTNWDNGGYNVEMFTQMISTAAAAGAEFVTLADLAARVVSFDRSSVTSSVAGNVVTATVVSADAGRFALDLDNLDGQVIGSVSGWYAYDADSVFMDRDGGTFAVTLGASAQDVTHITALPARSELVSLSGDGSSLTFTAVGEGKVVIDLRGGFQASVSGATIISQVGDILTLDLGAIGAHTVAVNLGPASNAAPVITSNAGGATGAISIAENSSIVTTVTASNAEQGQTLTYSIAGGADAGKFSLNSVTGVLSFVSPPDREAPADAGLNNVYDVIVQVSDNGVPSAEDTQALAVTVTNVAGITNNGTPANDIINGGGEEDSLSGAGGNDTINGNSGNDTLNG